MRFSLAALALASVSSVLAVDHLVLVGDGGALAFNPTSVTVAAGDTVSFEFRAKNHSVTQSTFVNPCALMTTPKQGVDSGFQATSNTTTSFAQWKITIDDPSAPLWFFCAQTNPKNHCQAGMVFAINPTAEKSFDAYLQNALNSATGGTGGSSSSTTAAGLSTTTGTTTAAGFTTSSTGAAGALTTSLGSIASVPTAALGASGAIVSGTGSADQATTTNGAVRLGSTIGGLVSVAGVLAMIL